MKRILFLIVSVLIYTLNTQAQILNLEDARAKALFFFHGESNKKTKTLKAQEPQEIECAYMINEAGIYIFENKGAISKGFVIIGPNKNNEPSILGYSETQFDKQSIPPSFKWWLNQHKTNGRSTMQSNNERRNIAPLVTTKWGQNAPYNNSIPSLGSEYKKFPTGCTATAFSQIMNFWQYPESGTGNNSYNISYYGLKTLTFSADFQNTRYDWNNMLDNYDTGNFTDKEALAVSTLMYHMGVAENMKYGETGSSANSSDGAIALINNFGYDKSIRKARRLYYSDNEWRQLIIDELSNGRPVYYSGDKLEADGHAFIIHGYDAENDLFAINWGWAGSCDGYFSLTARNPLNPYQPQKTPKSKISFSEQSILLNDGEYYDDSFYYSDDECEKTPSLIYDLFDTQGKYKSLKGVCCDGLSQIKIVLQNGSFLPETKCGYTYEWTLSEPIGKLSNNDNPREVIYTAPDIFPGNDNESTYTIKAKIHYSNGEHQGTEEVDIQIARVPLLLVHGLKDNCSTWFPFENDLVKKGAYRRNMIWCSDYSSTNCSHFNTNRLVVSNGIKILQNNTLLDGFISKKVDVVGHSMGGILARLHIQYNNGAENINKLITVNTPHSGSPLGDVFGNYPEIVKPFGFWSVEAINDLALNSEQIDNVLNNSSTIGKLCNVPVHAIETEYTGGISASYSNWVTALAAIMANAGIHMFYGDSNDGVVSSTSQRGGCKRTSHFNGLNHVISHKNTLVQNKIFSLLKSPKNSSDLSNSGFNPVDLHWGDPKNKSNRNTKNLTRANSTSKIYIEQNGDSLEAKISDIEHYSSCISTISFGGDSLCFFETPSFKCKIPDTYIGKVDIVTILGDGTGFSYLADSLLIKDSKLTLNKIEHILPKDSIFIGDIMPLFLKCTWSDGTITETSPREFVYSNDIISLNNGLLQAINPGKTNVKFEYRGASCTAVLEVFSRGELKEVSEEDIYNGNYLDEPGYNNDQIIYYNIKPNEGGEFAYQISSRDGITMISSRGESINKKIINRADNVDEQLKFSFTPWNEGFQSVKFDYGVIIQNLVNGQMFFQKGGSTDNLSSRELRPGYYWSAQMSFNTNTLPYNGVYCVYPAFSVDGGSNWNKMNYNISEEIPILEITGGDYSEKINLPLSISNNEIQIGKTANFNYSNYYKGDITYASSNSNVAEVAYDGTVTAKSIGEAIISVNIGGDDNFLSEERKFLVTVVEHKMRPLLISISTNKLRVGESTKIKIPIEFKGVVSYEIKPSGIIRILSDGTIEALKPGFVTFYASSSNDEDYYETVNSFTIKVIEDELDMNEQLSIKNVPTIGIDNVISDGNSEMIVSVYNNTYQFIKNATIYYTINLDNGVKSRWYCTADLSPETSYTLRHDLFQHIKNMTPGKNYTCDFYLDSERTIPMNLPSVTFTYGEEYVHQIELFDTHFRTISLPFDANIPNGMKAYTIRAYYENTVLLSEASFLNKHNSYIICGNPQKYTFSGILYPVKENPTSGFMTGLHISDYIPANAYYVDNKGENLIKTNFIKQASRWTAYVTFPNSVPEHITIKEGTLSDIKDLLLFTGDNKVSGIFTINGLKIPTLQKGVNIIRYSSGETLKVLVE